MADERTPSVASPSNTAEIELALMPQQSGIRASSEDWTGVTNRAKRRKLQNLLNQRAYREIFIKYSLCLLNLQSHT